MASQRSGGGNGNSNRRRRRRLRQENAENINEYDSDDFDAAIQNYEEARELVQARISELEEERDKREKALQNFSKNLNKMWDEIMEPITCSEEDSSEEDSDHETGEVKHETSIPDSLLYPSGKPGKTEKKDIDISFSSSSDDDDDRDIGSPKVKRRKRIKKQQPSQKGQVKQLSAETKEASTAADFTPLPSTSQGHNTSSSQESGKKTYQKSLSSIMYEWAKYQPDFKAEMEQLRKEKFRNEDDIEKFAFFKIFEKKNEDYKAKLMDASKKRSEEWKQLKGQKKNQLKAKFKEEFRSWMTNEKSTRLKEDRKRRKREYKQLRVVYLDGRIDKRYQDKNSAVDHQSSTPQEAMDNTADEDTKSAQESKETQDLNIQGSGSRIPPKKAKNLR